ncbi:uncharacterized protein LOC107274607 isoform X2 [Cephus cinctus]|uniref:Uncharacterized protein LOC107274607 isoform X2 n=1 Tax=Cephus cinctus TaxID=211228 RepID=A0AAJ7CFG7_CEPCN|nr:uncharacterized protein LOC107274607 isoform X2 [Cephus cinctus]
MASGLACARVCACALSLSTLQMEGPTRTIILILALGLAGISGASAIQTDRTSLRSARDYTVLGAPSVYSAHERTPVVFRADETSDFQRTLPTLHLESSKSLDDVERDETHYVTRSKGPEEGIDVLTSSKHVDQIDGNNIEVKPGEYFRDIAPTKSEDLSGEGPGAPQGRGILSGPQNPLGSQNQQHHLRGSFQQRQSRQETPRIYSDHAPPPVLQTASAGHRQSNPDIQDIITGIVKLLNGNVNVAVNTGRPLRPIQATRINNRGPPRISDSPPPLPPDYHTPGMNPPPPPSLPEQPYPFEKPPAPERPSVNQLPPERPMRPFLNGVPVPEQIVPQGNRPWNRPSRPGNNRRPIPPYKPLPPIDATFFNDKEHSELDKPHFELKPEVTDVGSKLEADESTSSKPEMVTRSGTTETTTEAGKLVATSDKQSNLESTTKKYHKYQPPLKEDKIVSENTLILGAHQQSYPIPNYEGNLSDMNSTAEMHSPETVIPLEGHPEVDKAKSNKTEVTKDQNPSKHREEANDEEHVPAVTSKSIRNTVSQTTLNIETSSYVQVIEPTPSIMEIQPTVIPLEANEEKSPSSMETEMKLEPSKNENLPNLDTALTSATPVDGLPSFTKPPLIADKTHTHPSSSTFSKSPAPTDYYPYRPRPGIVLDDTLDYTGSPGLPTQRPYPPSRYPQNGDIFDVTVSAIQGPGGSSGESVRVPVTPGGSDVILTSAVEGQGFVSIDGKRTYVSLFDNTDPSSGPTPVQPQPTRTQPPQVIGTGYAVAQPDPPPVSPKPSAPIRRPTFHRRPTQPPVRIDTCIVGDSSTCDGSQHEACATVQGVSACHCKPGYARLQHSLPCKKIISIVVSMRVDKIYDKKIVWDLELSDKDSDPYQTLSYEANKAIESAMSMTPFSDEYMGSLVNNIYQGDVSQGQGGVFVNATLKLTYEPRTARPALAGELQRHLLGVIHRRNNNIGNSALYVDSPPGSISNLQDLDECVSSELNDCHSSAICTNTWGGFTCSCNPGLKDPHKDDPNEAGRFCLSCPSTHCNNRGTCSYQGDQMQCTCTGNYYGAQCEVDGEVLGVAIGASVAALIIIVLTLVCLVMWSRRWSREQKAVGSPVYGYMQGGIPGTLPARVGSVGTLASVKQGPPTSLPPYMWAHIADHMATANLYATEPMGPTRPSSAMFGYPTMSVHGTLPPVPLPRLQAPPRPRQRHQPEPDSSDSEPQDKDRADLIPQSGGFHVPRPKSRSSLANQSGIYYDVEYDQSDSQHLSKNNIPMSTYSMARPYYRT